ncbi:MAG TPA: response regulator, partial [Leptolinea sp.]
MSDPKKILILEDNVMMRSLLQTLLELENFQVTCPTFPLGDPIRMVQQAKPDIILMDVNLPGTNGISLVESIRGVEDIGNTKIIMSSGSDRELESINAGADSFLMKPYMPDDLIHMIK